MGGTASDLMTDIISTFRVGVQEDGCLRLKPLIHGASQVVAGMTVAGLTGRSKMIDVQDVRSRVSAELLA